LTIQDYDSNAEIQKHYQELKSWDWNFGQTPYFTQTVDKTIDNQKIKMMITVKRGLIHDITPHESTCKQDLIQKLKNKWVNQKYEKAIQDFIDHE
jgi:hypothetical protein